MKKNETVEKRFSTTYFDVSSIFSSSSLVFSNENILCDDQDSFDNSRFRTDIQVCPDRCRSPCHSNRDHPDDWLLADAQGSSDNRRFRKDISPVCSSFSVLKGNQLER